MELTNDGQIESVEEHAPEYEAEPELDNTNIDDNEPQDADEKGAEKVNEDDIKIQHTSEIIHNTEEHEENETKDINHDPELDQNHSESEEQDNEHENLEKEISDDNVEDGSEQHDEDKDEKNDEETRESHKELTENEIKKLAEEEDVTTKEGNNNNEHENHEHEHSEDDDDVQVQGDTHSEYSDIHHQSTAEAINTGSATRGNADISSGTIHETIKT